MNRRGQAMIESLFVGLILVLALSLFLRVFARAQKNILVDEFIEETLICLVQKKLSCVHVFQQRLRDLGFSNISVHTQRNQSRWILHLKATSSFKEKIEKESELEYESQIQI